MAFPIRSRAVGFVILLVLAGAAYWPALLGQFVWDDPLFIERNPLVTGLFGFRSVWFHTDFPLSIVLFHVQYLIWGKSALGYHLVNLFLHFTNCLLIWRILNLLRVPGGWFSAALFLIHPVCVMSVAWISEFKNTLSLFFYLLSLGWFIQSGMISAQEGTEAASGMDGERVRRWKYLFSLCAFLLALSSKTSTVMLPVTLLLCIWWERGRVRAREWLRVSPFFVLAGCFGALTVWFQKHQTIGDLVVQTENFGGRLANAGLALWFYLGKALLPIHLSAVYPRWEVASERWSSYVPLLAWGALILACWLVRKHRGRSLLFGLGFFMMNLVPVLGFFDMYFFSISRVSDHLQYIPLIGITSLAGSGVSLLIGERRNGFVAGVAALMAISVLAGARTQTFATDERLWRDTLVKNPRSWLAHDNLGALLAEQGKVNEARDNFLSALRLRPLDAQAHCNLGNILADEGKNEDARQHFEAAIKSKPADGAIRAIYGAFLASGGKTDAALQQFEYAAQYEPLNIKTRLQLGTLLYQTGRFAQAAEQYRQILKMDGGAIEALSNLAWLLATCPEDSVRNGLEAVRYAERACQATDFKDARSLGVLAAAYAEQRNFSNAVSTAEKAIQVARMSGQEAFAQQNQRLQALYRSGQPYREPPPPR